MGMRAAHHGRMQQVRQDDIIVKCAEPGDQWLIFNPSHGLVGVCGHEVSALKKFLP